MASIDVRGNIHKKNWRLECQESSADSETVQISLCSKYIREHYALLNACFEEFAACHSTVTMGTVFMAM